LLTQLSIR